jgi:hypothetical protein
MKIVQNCKEQEALKFPRDLPIGSVFKLKALVHTYLKIAGGYYVNLSTNELMSGMSSVADSTIDLVYPNARIVLE